MASRAGAAALAREQAERKARFCLATGISPSEYEQLTQVEIDAFTTEHNARTST